MSTKVLVRAVCAAVLLSVSAFAVDGVVLINQNTVMAAGGFPWHITQSGSYKLSGNLVLTDKNTTANTTAAILIDADHVSLDLNGFSISGPSTCTSPGIQQSTTTCTANTSNVFDGILSGANHISIYNGAIHGMSGSGIVVESGSDTRVENVDASANSFNGISISSGIVNRCIASNNGSSGILSGRWGIIESSTANFNNFDGIALISGIASGNVALSNGERGLFLGIKGLANVNMLSANGLLDLELFGISVSNHNNDCSGSTC